jgi:protein involved in polysaccharide export with SLBB domain
MYSIRIVLVLCLVTLTACSLRGRSTMDATEGGFKRIDKQEKKAAKAEKKQAERKAKQQKAKAEKKGKRSLLDRIIFWDNEDLPDSLVTDLDAEVLTDEFAENQVTDAYLPVESARQPLAQQAPHTSQSANSYRLSPGDKMHVAFPAIPDQSFDAVIRPDGFITSPRYGDIPAMGWMPEQLADSLTSLYWQDFVNSKSTVTVTHFGPKFFYVFGEVGKPSRYELDTPMTLLSGITTAGGLQRSASVRNVFVLKVGPDGAYEFDVHDLSIMTEYEATITWLAPNDIIIVPERAISNAAHFIDDYVMNFLAPADAFLRGRYYWHLATDIR